MHGHRSQYVRRSAGEPLNSFHMQQAPKHPPKKMFWGCFTLKGTSRLCPIEGMMNSTKYQEILETKLVPSMQQSFADGNGIFQQNPIESLWAIMKKRLQKSDCSAKTKLIEAIIRIWYHDDEVQNICSILANSMPTRISRLINAKGGHIKTD